MTHPTKTLACDRGGATAVEFALLCAPAFLLMMGGIEMGVGMFAKARLEGTLREAARMSTTGDPGTTALDGKEIDAMVRERLRIVQDTQVDIERKTYQSFAQVGSPERKISGGASPPYCFEDVNGNRIWDLDPGVKGLGRADDIVDYNVTVTYPSLFPLVTKVLSGDGTTRITARTTLRNEPFAGISRQSVKTCCVSSAAGNPTTCS